MNVYPMQLMPQWTDGSVSDFPNRSAG